MEEDTFDDEVAQKVGVLLSTSSEIVEKILSAMKVVEISRYRNVCHLWNRIANKILASRSTLHFTTRYSERNISRVISTDVLAVDFPLLYDRSGTTPLGLSSDVCKNFKNSYTSLPHLCIVFQTLIKNLKKAFHDDEFGFERELRKVLPHNCSSVHVTSYGLIGTYEDMNVARVQIEQPYQPVENREASSSEDNPLQPSKRRKLNPPPRNSVRKPAVGGSVSKLNYHGFPPFNFTMICLPKTIPGVEFIPIKLLPRIEPINFSMTPEEASQLLYDKYGLKEDLDIKALLVFNCNRRSADNCLEFIHTVATRNKGCVAVAGCIPCRTFANIPKESIEETGDVCVAVCGPGVQAGSLLLGSDVDTERDLEAELTKLHKFHNTTKRSVAFMFPCIGRAESWYENESVSEVQQFRKKFPYTPVFGTYGEGEFHHQYLPMPGEPTSRRAEELESISRDFLAKDRYLYSYSHSILFLQFE